MTLPMAILIAGLLVFLAHLFAAFFERSRIPDVLPLLFIGLFLGPIFHFVSPRNFGRVGDVFSLAALVIILFQGGLELQISHLRQSFGFAMKLALLNFAGSLIFFGLFAKAALGWTWVESALLGTIAAATSSAVVIPLSQKLRLEAQTKAALVLEAAFSDVLCIVITLALLEAERTRAINPIGMLGHILVDFSVAVFLGAMVAILWASLLNRVRRIENSILMTPALVCVVFGVTEAFGISGAIAALAFGTTLGNIEPLVRLFPRGVLPAEPLQLDAVELSFIGEIAFLIKTFFFIYIGLSIHLEDVASISIGLVLASVALAWRIPVVRLTVGRTWPAIDRRLSAIMVPKGLASAVLATMVVQARLPIGPTLQSLIYALIIFSIVATAVLSYLVEKDRLGWPYKSAFPDEPIAPPAVGPVA